MPVIGVIGAGSRNGFETSAKLPAGLREFGYVEGQNASIEYRLQRAGSISCRGWEKT